MSKFSYALMVMLVVVTLCMANKNSSTSQTQNYHVSENKSIGTVIMEPKDLGGGIYLIQVQMDESNPEKPTVFPAVTAYPEKFPLGSKAKLKSVTATGQYAAGDMFRIAVDPNYKEKRDE